MEYEVAVADEPIDGLLRARLYVRAPREPAKGQPGERERMGRRHLVASFSAPTWRHLQDEAKALRTAHAQERTFVFDGHDDLVPKGEREEAEGRWNNEGGHA